MAKGNGMADEVREQQEKLKDMDTRSKLSYFFYYYKYHVLIGGAVGIFIFSVIFTMITQKACAFYCVMLNTDGYYESAVDESARFAEYAGINTNKYEVTLDTGLKITGNDGKAGDELSYNSLAKLMALIEAESLDSLIGNNEVMETYGRQYYFKDMREVLGGRYETFAEQNLIYIVMTDNMEAIPIGIKVSDSPVLTQDLYKNSGELYIAIPQNSKNVETAVKFIEYLGVCK